MLEKRIYLLKSSRDITPTADLEALVIRIKPLELSYAMPPTWYESGKISVFTSTSLLSSTYITDLQIEELS